MAWTAYNHRGVGPKGIPVRDGVLVVRYSTKAAEPVISGVNKTSTSTIAVSHFEGNRLHSLSGPDGMPPGRNPADVIRLETQFLRMFDIPGNEVFNWFVDVEAINRDTRLDINGNPRTPADFYNPSLIPDLAPDPLVASYLSYLDSGVADLPTTGVSSSLLMRELVGTPTEFVIDLGTAPLGQSAIPTRRVAPAELVEVVERYDDPNGLPTVTATTLDMLVRYKDPGVVAIPDSLGGGWLCLLARLRFQVELDAADRDGALSDPDAWDSRMRESLGEGDPEPHNSIGDVVGWVCDSPSFTGSSLKGPFLFVSSIGQLADPEVVDGRATGPRFAPFRVWAGVPSAAFVGEDLYLYASGHPNGRQGSEPSELTPYLDQAAGFDAAVSAFRGGQGFDQAVLTRRVPGALFRTAVLDATPIPEAQWTWQDVVGGAPTATALHRRGAAASHLGVESLADAVEPVWPARVMLGEPGSSRRSIPLVDAIESAMEAAGTLGDRSKGEWPPLVTDPTPLVCGAALSLYVSAVPGKGPVDLAPDGETLHGIWRAAALPEGTRFDLWTGGSWSQRQARFGVDFVAASVGVSSGTSPDQVARSWSTYAVGVPEYEMYLDPDPLRLALWADGVRVYAGCDGPPDLQVASLRAFQAVDSEACAEAEVAWDAPVLWQWQDAAARLPPAPLLARRQSRRAGRPAGLEAGSYGRRR